jgi:hypothetical protein
MGLGFAWVHRVKLGRTLAKIVSIKDEIQTWGFQNTSQTHYCLSLFARSHISNTPWNTDIARRNNGIVTQQLLQK